MVSRRHARIAYEDEDWWLTVDGRNGLKADGSSIAMNEKITLANGYSLFYLRVLIE
jgi:predicted component of type VI protein secretion system